MRKSLRLIAVLLTLTMGLALLSGCHGSQYVEPEFEVPDLFDESLEYEITFWAKNDTNKNQTDIYYKAIKDFQTLYPNITVNMRLYTDYSKIYNDVITNIATGTTPNICITYPDHIATYMQGENVVVNLDEIMADPLYGLGGSELRFESPTVDEIVPEFLEECKLEGSYYAMPYMRSTEACYVNVTMLEKLGYELPEVLTWDFIFEVSEAAMKKANPLDKDSNYKLNGQKTMIPTIYKSTDNMMISYLKQAGAGYSEETGEIKLFNDTTKDFLYEISSHAKTGAFSTFQISSYPANFLNAGQCIFAIDSTAGATWMGAHAPLSDISADKFVEFETVVMEIPQVDPENPQMISQGPSVCLFNKSDTGEVMASWLFMQYLLSNDVQIAYAETEGYIPVTTKAQNDPSYVDYLNREGEDNAHYYDVKIQASKLLLKNTENTFTTAVFNGSASLRSAAGALIENVTKSTRRKKTVDDEFLENLFDEVTAQYHLNEIVVKKPASQEASEGEEETAAEEEIPANERDLGPLPEEVVVMLWVLGIVWALIILYVLTGFIRKIVHKS